MNPSRCTMYILHGQEKHTLSLGCSKKYLFAFKKFSTSEKNVFVLESLNSCKIYTNYLYIYRTEKSL